jgi:hypothetical protein
MAKRFTASEKWEDIWFSELPTKYKLFWVYLLDKCDNAGVWEKNFRIANFLIGETFTEADTLAIFKERVIEFGDNKWFIPKFIDFQYGTLQEHSNPHKAVIEKLRKYGLYKNGDFKGINTLKNNSGRVKDKDKDKDKDKGNPEIQDVITYFNQNGYTTESATKAFNYYSANDWKDSKGKPVKSWKQKMIGVWFKDENKIPANVIRLPDK